MQFLTVSRRRIESFGPEEFAARMEDEAQRVRTLYAEGVIRRIWTRGDVPGACILMEAESLEQVDAVLASLPLYQAGMLEIVSIVPLKPYAGFGPR